MQRIPSEFLGFHNFLEISAILETHCKILGTPHGLLGSPRLSRDSLGCLGAPGYARYPLALLPALEGVPPPWLGLTSGVGLALAEAWLGLGLAWAWPGMRLRAWLAWAWLGLHIS